jgi:hypothetical protein
MNRKQIARALCALAAGAILFGAGLLAAKAGKQPQSVIHVVTLYWKAGITDAQKQAALDGVVQMSRTYPGIKNIWVKSIKVQGKIGEHAVQSAFVMEFANQKALDNYKDSAAQKEWYKVYLPARGESRTFDITN